MATAPERDHAETAAFLKKGTLLPLERMLTMNVGSSEGTEIAYPAAGSLAAYLVQKYGFMTIKRAWALEARDRAAKQREDTWTAAVGKSAAELEREWRAWLLTRGSKS